MILFMETSVITVSIVIHISTHLPSPHIGDLSFRFATRDFISFVFYLTFILSDDYPTQYILNGISDHALTFCYGCGARTGSVRPPLMSSNLPGPIPRGESALASYDGGAAALG